MTLIDTDDQRDLANSVKRFVSGQAPMSAVRKTIASEAAFDPDVWRRLSQELGVAGLPIPEQYGGAGASWSDLIVALRELGTGLVPTPVLATSVLATGTLLALDDEEARREWLPRFAEGTAIGTLAVSEGGRGWTSAGSSTGSAPASTWRGSRRGHQNRSPSTCTRAGTSTVRTSRVSSSTPSPTMMPISVSTITGSTPSTVNTAASRMPALVITPPVRARASMMPSRVPCRTASSWARETRKML